METEKRGAESCFKSLRELNLLDENGHIRMDVYARLPVRTPKRRALGAIFGDDNRIEVLNPLTPPTGPILCLAMVFNNILYRGTGFLATNSMVLTAGHNLYDHDLKKMADEVLAFGAFAKNPYKAATAVNLNVTSAFEAAYTVSEDWGTIRLDKPLGNDATIGVMPVRAAAATDKGAVATVTGFPWEVRGIRGQTEMFTASGPLAEVSIADKELLYTIPTSGGNSGSPVYVKSGQTYTAIGIHVCSSMTTNHARLIDEDILNALPHP